MDLLQMLEMNTTIAFPAAPLGSVILALVSKYTFLFVTNSPFLIQWKPDIRRSLGPGNSVCYIRYVISVVHKQYKTKQINVIGNTVVEDKKSMSTCRVKFYFRRRHLSTKQWSGPKCDDVPTKIETSNYAMHHRDWPGKQRLAEHPACWLSLTCSAFRKQLSLFEGIF